MDPSLFGQAAAAAFWHALHPETAQPASPDALSREDINHLGRLAHAAQTVQRIKEGSWWQSGASVWQESLQAVGFAAAFIRVARTGGTGILHVYNDAGDERFIAFVAGQLIAIASPNKTEALGSYLIERGLLAAAAAEQAQAHVAGTDKPVGWALLSLQLLTPERLFVAQQEQAQHLVQQLLGWARGVAEFYDNPGAVDLRRIVDANNAALLHDAYAHVYTQDAATLQKITAPFFARAEPLLYTPVPDSVVAMFEGIDHAIVDCAAHAQPPDLLLRAVSGRPAPDLCRVLADVYVLNQLGALSFAAAPEHVRLLHLPTPLLRTHPSVKLALPAPVATGSASKPDALALYQAHKEMLGQAKRALYTFAPDKAATLLAEILAGQPEPTSEVLAYHALALVLQGDVARAQEQAVRAMKLDAQDAMAHAAMAQVFDATANSNGAYHRKYAMGLSQNNALWHTEVVAALGLSAKPQQPKAAQSDGRALYLWILASITGLGLFAASIIFRMGGREYDYVLSDRFFFIRRGVLFLVGCAGTCFWLRKTPLKALREANWRFSSNMLIAAILWGIIAGSLSPVQRVRGPLEIVLLLTVLHVIAEEVFFRGFLTRMLIDQIDDKHLPLLVSAIIYGVYHLTYQGFWIDLGIQPRSFYIGIIALFAGWPYAWMLRTTRSIVPSTLCHLGVNGLMMLHSLVVRDGWSIFHISQ